ncbi:MAG: hypothetical protein ACI9J3_002363 [Parvicellaceae bacterium]|jgi:hypothetical protein
MKVLITQSNYIPWKGFFDNIAMVDVYVVYDDMLYTKRDWRNRNMIKTTNGIKWLTIPIDVKGKRDQKINAASVSKSDLESPGWKSKHFKTLHHAYSKSKCFNEVIPWIKNLYDTCESNNLTEINLHFIKAINQYLGIHTKLVDSREFSLKEDPNERIISICKDLNANSYYTGPKANSYLKPELFKEKQLKLNIIDYSGYPQYEQAHPPFKHEVSILDLIFSEGSNAQLFLKHCK